jgi:hypothetical protein
MPGQMCWLPVLGSGEEKVLHLRNYPNEPWKPYTACSSYFVSDYTIPQGSKGWATYQRLIKNGWIIVPNAQAYSLQKSAKLELKV